MNDAEKKFIQYHIGDKMKMFRRSAKFAFLFFNVILPFGLCITNLNQLGGTLTLAPHTDGRRNQCLTGDLSSLYCDFNKVCAYGSSYENQWAMTNGYGDQNQWTTSVGTGITATPKSVAVQLNSNAPKATLISDPIACTGAGQSQIYFSYWLTSNVNLFVCFVGQTSGRQVCNDQLGQQSTGYPGPKSFTFTEPFDEPFTVNCQFNMDSCQNAPQFTIQFKAFLTSGLEGFLILDDVGFYASICSNPTTVCSSGQVQPLPSTLGTLTLTPLSTSTASLSSQQIASSAGASSSLSTVSTRINTVASSTAAGSLTTPPPRTFDNPCQALDCNFEKNMCNYYNSPKQTTAWKRVHKNIDTEQLSDIWTNDKYFLSTEMNQSSTAGANGKKDPAVAVLESSHFNLKPGVEYLFKLDYFAKGKVQSQAENGVRICFVQSGADPAKDYENRRCSRLNTTLTNQPDSGYEGWKHLAIPLGAKVYKIYFITVNQDPSTNFMYGIDNIALDGCS